MSMNFRRSTEQRSISYQDVWGNGGDINAIRATGDAALSLVPLYSAIRIIAQTFESTPLYAYRQAPDGTSIRLPNQPRLLTNPSPFGHALTTWKGQCIVSLLMRGNAYGLITSIGSDGTPGGLVWLNPDDVSIYEPPDGSRPTYYWQGYELKPWEIVHIPWIVKPGKWEALSPLAAFKEAIETGIAAQTMARDWYANNSIPGGHLKNTQKVLDKTEAVVTKAQFKSSVANKDIFVSGSDWDFHTFSVPPDQAQFVQTLQLSANQIAGIYGVPAEKIGGTYGGAALHYSSDATYRIDFMESTMRPWFAKVEDHLSNLLTRPVFARFDMDSMVRSDVKTRMEGYEVGLRIGALTNDEVRKAEDRAPLSDAEKASWRESFNTQSRDMHPAELIQKIYLGVGKVITAEEARDILRQNGVDLPKNFTPSALDTAPPSPEGSAA